MKWVLKKILITLILVIMINMLFLTKTNAISNMIKDADFFLGKGNSPEQVIDEESLKNTSDTFYTVFVSIGIVIAVVIGLIIGIKYIYESAEGQAKLKEAFVPYIFGCIIVFGSFSIWKIVINFGNNNKFLEEEYSYSRTEAKNLLFENYEIVANKKQPWKASTDEIRDAWNYVRAYNSEMSDVDIVINDTSMETWNIYIAYLSTQSKDKVKQQWDEYCSRTNLKTSLGKPTALELDEDTLIIVQAKNHGNYKYHLRNFWRLAYGLNPV